LIGPCGAAVCGRFRQRPWCRSGRTAWSPRPGRTAWSRRRRCAASARRSLRGRGCGRLSQLCSRRKGRGGRPLWSALAKSSLRGSWEQASTCAGSSRARARPGPRARAAVGGRGDRWRPRRRYARAALARQRTAARRRLGRKAAQAQSARSLKDRGNEAERVRNKGSFGGAGTRPELTHRLGEEGGER